MKKIVLLVLLVVLTACSGLGQGTYHDSEKESENQTETKNYNLSYSLDDKKLKSGAFIVGEIVAFQEDNTYIYLKLEDVAGFNCVYYDRKNGDYVKEFLDQTTGNDEYLIKLPNDFFNVKETLVIGFWKENDDEAVNIFVTREDFKLCFDEEKISQMESRFADEFKESINLIDKVTIDNEDAKIEPFNLKKIKVYDKGSSRVIGLAFDSVEYLNAACYIYYPGGYYDIDSDLVGTEIGEYTYSCIIEKSFLNEACEVCISIWETGKNESLSLLIPIDALTNEIIEE